MGLQRKQPQQPTVSLRRRLSPLGAGIIYKICIISTERSLMGKVPSAKVLFFQGAMRTSCCWQRGALRGTLAPQAAPRLLHWSLGSGSSVAMLRAAAACLSLSFHHRQGSGPSPDLAMF